MPPIEPLFGLERAVTALRVLGTAILCGLLALVAAMALPRTAAAEVPSDQVPDQLKTAIQSMIEGSGAEYAGFCRDIEQGPSTLGKTCVFVQSLTADRAEVTFGRVASDEIRRVFFVKEGGTWVVSGTPAPVNTPVPPNTGSGGTERNEGSVPFLALSLIAGLIGLGAVVKLAARSRS